MAHIDTLDVTIIEPKLKHPAIFEKFDSLSLNDAFIIHNDHDPKPLYYQLLGERGKTFTWEYLENGPEYWKVKISKRGGFDDEQTIGEMVAKDYRKAQVFKNWGIDFCCGGKRTLEEVCKTKRINIERLREQLESENLQSQHYSLNYNSWELDFLADYIVNTHHQYVKDNIPFIGGLANKVAGVHGDKHAELIEVAKLFNKLATDLSLHMIKEENVVFPFIKELVASKKSPVSFPAFSFDNVNTPVQILEMEHEIAGEDMAAIHSLTSGYTLPEDACASYTVLYKKLMVFENDLFMHVHLENNILFPKAIQLRKELSN
jgi:regulator of cell morphogenesis and NO signaling